MKKAIDIVYKTPESRKKLIEHLFGAKKVGTPQEEAKKTVEYIFHKIEQKKESKKKNS